MNDTELMKIIREAIAQATSGDKAASKCVCDGEVEDIKAAKEKLTTSAQGVFTKMYENVQAQQGAAGAAGAGPQDFTETASAKDNGDDVIDGDFREV